MKSSIYVKRQSFEIRLNSVSSFVFAAFCQSRISRYSARDVTDIFVIIIVIIVSLLFCKYKLFTSCPDKATD